MYLIFFSCVDRLLSRTIEWLINYATNISNDDVRPLKNYWKQDITYQMVCTTILKCDLRRNEFVFLHFEVIFSVLIVKKYNIAYILTLYVSIFSNTTSSLVFV